MNKLICGNCKHDLFDPLNPEESRCQKCGKIHERLSDYGQVSITEEEN